MSTKSDKNLDMFIQF